MEQKDYLMREIGKIGLLLRALIGRMIHEEEDSSFMIGNHFEETKEVLFNETGLDLEKLISMDEASSAVYLLQFKGINSGNLELLAELLVQFGKSRQSQNKKSFLRKALQLYALCKRTDKTFSFDREKKIEEIKTAQNRQADET